jgi:Asp-tRNA(Asn)/Glu-tRNA(Gln) amidotransferase A subunit family amidase
MGIEAWPSVMQHPDGGAMIALYELGAIEAARAIRQGAITSEAVVRSCLDRVAVADGEIEAWAFLEPEYALEQARKADAVRAAGGDLGPLHGVPVGVKDVFDTADMPTENGTVLHAGRRPTADAMTVALLRQAGAVILGKTVCTELGLVAPGKTHNPHDPSRTPGGSSSGSAAAVAAGMVPLATGSQNNGSVIRPASFCGVCGYKPTAGRISRAGVLRQSPSLDQIGVFGRTVEDVALLARELMAFDPRDTAMRSTPRPDLLSGLGIQVDREPRLALVKTPIWAQAAPETQLAFERLASRPDGPHLAELVLPDVFAEAAAFHRDIIEPELALAYAAEYAMGKERLSATLCQIIERGQSVLATKYLRALERMPSLAQTLDDLLTSVDAVLTPATPGEAPRGLDSTGSPAFCTIWTLCGVPTISLPLLAGADGMPLGVQLVAARGQDDRLLRTARWLMQAVAPTR